VTVLAPDRQSGDEVVEHEVVQHDDPGTAAVAERWARRHPDVGRIVTDWNWPKNKPKALNTALPHCRGEIVGVFDAGGSSFDSEVWGDSHLLTAAYDRPDTFFQSATVHLTSPDALNGLKDALTTDPRLNVDVMREIDYYSKQSRTMTTMITVLGRFVAFIMAIGAVFGALNTMYSAVAARGREIATLRALGFQAGPVLVSVMAESLLLALLGGSIGGGVAYLVANGYQTATMNFQTFSQVAFQLAVTPRLLVGGVAYALAMGICGGIFPAVRAVRAPIAMGLREV